MPQTRLIFLTRKSERMLVYLRPPLQATAMATCCDFSRAKKTLLWGVPNLGMPSLSKLYWTGGGGFQTQYYRTGRERQRSMMELYPPFFSVKSKYLNPVHAAFRPPPEGGAPYDHRGPTPLRLTDGGREKGAT